MVAGQFPLVGVGGAWLVVVDVMLLTEVAEDWLIILDTLLLTEVTEDWLAVVEALLLRKGIDENRQVLVDELLLT